VVAAIDWSQYGRVLVLIDAANIGKSTLRARYKVSYRKLARIFQKRTRLVGLRFYSAEFETGAHRDFIRSLQRFGYQVVSKPVKEIRTGKTLVIRKANFDVEMAVDAMEMLDSYDTLVLFSGDNDFAYLLRHLQSKRKQVVVSAMRHNVARELVATADLYRDIRRLIPEALKKI
jgi:uncharacterized LabA/DUF88 family protein